MITRLRAPARARVDRAGIRVPAATRGVLDVAVEGHRVWSFDARRDGHRSAGGRLVPWPRRLRPFLVGTGHVEVRPHLGGAPLLAAAVAFDDTPARTAVVDPRGHHLSVDKGGRLERTFDRADDDLRRMIVSHTATVLSQLREQAGLEAFLAFGCLLGAVRDGRMIGHDCDADVAYLSRHDHPFDVIRENRRAADVMEDLGHRVVRMSDADFKVWLPLPDGRRCGIDVFAAYHRDGLLHLLPSVSGEVSRADLLPVGAVRLEGQDVVAPTDPERLLEVSYGPGWRTPDPSFRFTPPPALLRHMDDTWRGARHGTYAWNEFYLSDLVEEVPGEPSDFARWVHDRIGPSDALVDVSSGTGRDAAWLAHRGHHVVATESAHRARQLTRRAARRRRALSRLDVRVMNLNDVRTTLRTASQLAFDPVGRHVCARLVLGDLDTQARQELYRFADLVTRRGGSTFLEVRARGGGVAATRLREEVLAAGGRLLSEEPGTADGVAPRPLETLPTLRWTVRWDGPRSDRAHRGAIA